MVTFAPENAPELKFTVSWLLDAKFCIVTARGQQLRNCIPVGIHLNLIRGTWPRINQSQYSFC